MNWRKPIIKALLYLQNNKIIKILNEIRRIEFMPVDVLLRYQRKKLKVIIEHAYKNVPYYKCLFRNMDIINRNGIDWERFENIPILTKEIIRQQGNQLYSIDHTKRGSYLNTSGGSTGTPVSIMQDRLYSDWNIANTIYYKTFQNQDIGDCEVRLWGSERDLLEGSENYFKRFKDYLYNRTDLNSFRMSDERMMQFVRIINKKKPTWIEAYVQSADELAKYIQSNGLSIHSPRGLLTSAGTLFPETQKRIELIFQCKTYNRYGSREVGGIACNCQFQEGLHISIWNHYLEILNDKLEPVEPGIPGRVYITTLNNFSMPLIRYDIGDSAIGKIQGEDQCSCCRGTPLISSVRGRIINMFKNCFGELIDGEFFTHLLYHKKWCQKFQIIQKNLYLIIIRIVLDTSRKTEYVSDKIIIERDIHKVMGADCRIDWELCDYIEETSDGKYLYTISELQK